MQAIPPRSWKQEFALVAAMREEDILYREKMARAAARQRQITAEQEGLAKRRDMEAQVLLEQVLAPPVRVAEFRVTLDRYDTKTVEALMENREALEAVRRRIDDMLGKAHVLPDGRRVFKTADGQSVYDEHGQKLDRDIIDPTGIDDRKPKWEAFRSEKQNWSRLNEERQGLLDYQAKLDAARERIDGGDITAKQLDDIDRDLRNAMPDAVRAKVETDRPKAETAPSASSTPSMPDGMDTRMRQTGLGPSVAAGPR